MPSLRGNRSKSSGAPSPFARTANPSPSPAIEPKKSSTQTLLDAWVEPQPRTPVPSFEDHGFARGGVVTSMAPLGALPPLKFRVKAPTENRSEKQPVLLPPLEMDDSKTPEGTPPLPLELENGGETSTPAVAEPEPTTPSLESRPSEHEEDRVANGVGVAAQGASSPMKNGTPTTAQSRRTSTSQSTPYSNSKPTFARTPSRHQKLDMIVDAAVEHSRASGQPMLGLALKRLYHESQHDPTLAEILDAILRQTPTEEQRTQFAHQIKIVKKQLKVEEASAKRFQKSLQLSNNAHSPSRPTIGGHRYSGTPTIASPGSKTPPHPPPPLLSFYPFPASASTFLSSRSSFPPRSTTPPFPPSSLTNGAGATDDSMPASTRRTDRNAASAATHPSTAQSSVLSTGQPPVLPSGPSAPTISTQAADSAAGGQTANLDINVPNPVSAAGLGISDLSSTEANHSVPNGRTSKPAVVPVSPPAIISIEAPEEAPRSVRRKTRKAVAAAASASPSITVDQPVLPSPRRTRSTVPASVTAVVSQPASPSPPALASPPVESPAPNAPSTPIEASTPDADASEQPEDTQQRSRTTSMSPLSDVDQDVLDEGLPILPESPPRGSKGRSNTRLTLTNKGKSKKGLSGLVRPAAGIKRAAGDAGLSEPDEVTVKRRKDAEDRHKSSLEAKKKEWESAMPTSASDFRFSTEYEESMPRGSSRLIPPVEDGDIAGLQPSSAATVLSSARNAMSGVGPSASRRAVRDSTQKQQTVDLTAANVPNFAPGPSTPGSERGEPPLKRRKGIRNKQSPTKAASRQKGTAPGTTRESSPTGSGFHADDCCSCGITIPEVDLVVCDDCPNAFHYECYDPVLEKWDEEAQTGDPTLANGLEWFCHECLPQHTEPTDLTNPVSGIFGPVFNHLHDRNPKRFQLQPDLVNTFKDVFATDEGLYRDETDKSVPVNSRNKATIEYMDEGKLLLKDPNPAFCIACGLTVQSKPMLLKCDECHASWHLDCLDDRVHTDLPHVLENVKRVGNKEQAVFKRQYFKCPRHIDQNLRFFTHPVIDNDATFKTRGIKVRQFRNPKIVAPVVDRGHKNNGYIEIEHVSDDDGEEEEDEGFVEMPNTDGTVYKIKSHSIKLDFIAKAKQHRVYRAQTQEDLLKLLQPDQAEEVRRKINLDLEARINRGVEARMQEVSSNTITSMWNREDAAAIALTGLKKRYLLDDVEKNHLRLLHQASITVESAATSAATGVENTAQNAAEKIAELVADDMDLEEIEKLERLLAVAKAKVQADATAKASKAAGVKAAETKAADARDVAEVSASIYAPKSTAASADEGEEDEVVRPGKRQRRS